MKKKARLKPLRTNEGPTPAEPAVVGEKTGFRSIRDYLRRVNWPIVAMVLVIKAVILLFGAASYQVLANKRIETWRGWLEIWHRWDSMRYLRIAEVGYTNIGPDRHDLIGSPLFSWIVRSVALFFQDYLLSGFIVAGIASV